MKIKQIPILSPDQCADVAKRVRQLRSYWIDRGVFFTLGAATYQDDPKAYPAIANAFNTIIHRSFTDVLKELTGVIAANDEQPAFMPGTALPSFHVIDKRANGVKGSIHVDEPYDRIEWGQKVTDPFSFTMAIELPACGGGMNIWPDLTDADINAYEVDHAIPEPEYVPYELGVLYLHDGKTPHQMANPGIIGGNEMRITFQGHGVKLPLSGVTALYF